MDISSLPLYTVITSGQNCKDGHMLPYNDLDVKLVRYDENRRQTENNTTPHLTPVFFFFTTILSNSVFVQKKKE